MINLRKSLPIALCALLTSVPSLAIELTSPDSDITLQLTGYANFQAGHRSQSNLKTDEKNVSAKRQGFAFYNDTAILSTFSKKTGDGIIYGCQISLVPTAKRSGSPSYNGSHIFFESSYGKIEAGSPIASSSKMMIGGSDNAAGPGNWDRYANLTPSVIQQGSKIPPSFATSGDFFFNDIMSASIEKKAYTAEPSRAISFYTPKIEFGGKTKLQIGLTYIPDSTNTGADKPGVLGTGSSIYKDPVKGIDRFEITQSVKNAVTGGVTLEQNITDGVDVKLALTGEYGKSSGSMKQFATASDSQPQKEFKLSDLKAFNIGAVVNIGNFSCAGSFGSLGKSLTTPAFYKTGRNTDYYTGTIAYNHGPFAASVTYFKSNQFKNTVDVISVGTYYLLAPGFKPYAEISGFSLKGRPTFDSSLQKKESRGTVALIGAKLTL